MTDEAVILARDTASADDGVATGSTAAVCVAVGAAGSTGSVSKAVDTTSSTGFAFKAVMLP
jgi:hypothetical protein